MSIQKTNSTPNVYKLEKFVIVATIDAFGLEKLDATKPNVLECRKVYTAYDKNGFKNEFIDTATPYDVAVPLNVSQVDAYTSEDVENSDNSLICPPYIVTDSNRLDPEMPLEEQLKRGLIHRGSVIYAQKRDGGIDIIGGSQDGDPFETWSLTVVDYIDINADGRSLKISSQTNKSNNIDLTDSNISNLSNIYKGDPLTVQNLIKACIVNEDAGIDYITELDQVARLWQAAGSSSDTTVPVANTTYALIFNPSAGSSGGDYPVLRFKEVTSGNGDGGASEFTGLSDTPDSYTDQDNKLVQVKTGGSLEFTHLNTKNVDPSATTGDTGYFLVAQNAANGDATSMQLRKFESLLGNGNGYGDGRSDFDNFSSADDNSNGLGILTVDGDGSASKFRSLKYATQLGGVRVSTTIKTAVNAQADDGSFPTSRKALATISRGTPTHPKIIFDPIGNLITSSKTEEGTDVVIGGGSNVINSYFVVKNGTDGLEGAKLGDALYAGGVGSVKWDGNNMVLGVNTSHTETLEGDALKLRYEPKLFGICKENGDYEYRYFLTSAIIQ